MGDFEQITNNLRAIRIVSDESLDKDNVEQVVSKGNRLEALLGLSAAQKSNAKLLLNRKKVEVFAKYKESKMSPSVLVKLIDAEAGEEEALFMYADRLNAAVTHELDYIRSLISYYKEEMRMTT